MKKVLYLHQYFSHPKFSSSGTRSYEMARALVKKGHQVVMVCAGTEDKRFDLPLIGKNTWGGELDGIQVIVCNVPYSNHMSLLERAKAFLSYALKSISIALKYDYDIIFATSTPLTVALPGVIAKIFRRKKKFIFEVRDLWPELPKAMGVVKNPLVLWGMSLIEWLGYRSANACIGLSPGIVKGIQKRASKKLSVTMVPNGCDLDLFVPDKRENLKLEGINADDFVAIFTGAHGIANGLHAILDTAAYLKEKNISNIKFAFIGDGKMKNQLVQRAKEEGLDNCLFFDPILKLELVKIVACADVGLMILDNIPAFYYGTSPNKFFDYIAAGIPVINNYPGWLAGLIEESHSGIAVEAKAPEKMAEALIYLSGNPNVCAEMRRNSRMLAEKEFSRDKLSEKWTQVIEAV